jgi:hypothetical protein
LGVASFSPVHPTRALADADAVEQPEECLVSDFWRWGFSNLTDNTTRGVLAEFLVASALGRWHSQRVGRL